MKRRLKQSLSGRIRAYLFGETTEPMKRRLKLCDINITFHQKVEGETIEPMKRRLKRSDGKAKNLCIWG